MKFIFPLILTVLILICGCAHSTQVPATTLREPVTPAPTALPSPTPAPMTAEEFEKILSSSWEETFQADVLDYFPSSLFDAKNPWRFFTAQPGESRWLLDCAQALQEQLEESVSIAAQTVRETYGLPFRLDGKVQGPSWQLIAALLQLCESPEDAQSALWGIMRPAVTASKDDSGMWAARIDVEPLPYLQALQLAANNSDSLSSAQFLYAYLQTVFGPDQEELEYVQPPAEGSLARGITWPLGSHIRLRKTWYAVRGDGSRKHTGTDIWAEADTPIYSCTDGIITLVDGNPSRGFTVIVTDPYGYEFHYYHMIRQTDFLKAGDVVSAGDLLGNVGNTGNSDRDHLHLTILSPDGCFINPYPYLAAVEP